MTDQEFNAEFGARLRAVRKEKGLTLYQLASLTQAHKTTIMRIEKAEVSPSTNLLRNICIALDVRVEDLMGMS